MLEVRSRADAKAAGEKRYFTGQPCKFGHLEERWVSDGGCLACKRITRRQQYLKNPERDKKWQQDNREKCRQACRKYRVKHPDRAREQSRQWALRNPEKRRAAQQDWWKENKHRAISYSAKRRAVQRGAQLGDRKEYIEFVRWAKTTPNLRCSYCNEVVPPERRDIDHVIPLSRGGADSVDNLCVACLSCNRQKHAKTAEEFTALKLAS